MASKEPPCAARQPACWSIPTVGFGSARHSSSSPQCTSRILRNAPRQSDPRTHEPTASRNSVFLVFGNFACAIPDKGLIREMANARAGDLARFPSIFPVEQGIDPRDRFALACTHRHSVCKSGEPLHAGARCWGTSRDSAGFWGEGRGAVQAETAGRGGLRRNSCPSSPRAIETVRNEGRGFCTAANSGSLGGNHDCLPVPAAILDCDGRRYETGAPGPVSS